MFLCYIIIFCLLFFKMLSVTIPCWKINVPLGIDFTTRELWRFCETFIYVKNNKSRVLSRKSIFSSSVEKKTLFLTVKVIDDTAPLCPIPQLFDHLMKLHLFSRCRRRMVFVYCFCFSEFPWTMFTLRKLEFTWVVTHIKRFYARSLLI